MNILFRKIRRVKIKISRFFNKKHTYDFPPENGGWKKVGKINIPEPEGSVFDPYAEASDGKIRLLYSDRARNSIVMTETEDGEIWSNPETVITGKNDGSWENIVNRACLVKKNNCYLLWYTGQFNGKSAIGFAKSSDGKNFVRYKNNPVLTPKGNYEKSSVMNPCVIWDESESLFKMWYAAGESYEPDVICYAESEDGINWKKYPGNPIFAPSENEYDKCKVGGCDIHRNSDGSYVMYYIGYQNVDNARICLAYSPDGKDHWIRSEDNPIVSPSRGSWDAHAVYKPAVAELNGKTIMWYNGRNNDTERIGFAVLEKN